MKKLVLTLMLLAASLPLVVSGASSASSSVNYNNVISDAVFDNTGSMTAGQIDTFLNKFPNSCISQKNGYTFTDPTGYSPSASFTYGSNVTAGTVFAHAAQAYDINPQVLLTTTQKEEGMVDGSGPYGCSALAFSAAMGYGCTDARDKDGNIILYNYSGVQMYVKNGHAVNSIHGTCVNSSHKVGFSAQIINAAWLLSFDRHRSEGQNTWHIQKTNWDNSDDLNFCYSGPMANSHGKHVYRCPTHASGDPGSTFSGTYAFDGTAVTIADGATAALFHYTPHLHGQVLFYNAWTGVLDFGSLQAEISVSAIHFENAPYINGPVSASFTLRNTSKSTERFHELKIAARDPNGNNVDFPAAWSVSISPGKTYTYKETTTFSGPEGKYSFYVARNDGTSWHFPPFDDLYQPYNASTSLSLYKQPTLTSGLSLSANDLHANQSVTATFKVTNNSTLGTVEIGYIKPAVRDSSGHNYDFPYSPYIMLAPGSSYTYSESRTFDHKGKYNVWVSDKRNDYGWSDSFPASNSYGLNRSLDLNVTKAQVTLTAPLTIATTNGHAGNTATATFTVKNFGTTKAEVGYIKPAARGPNNLWADFPDSAYITLNPGASYTYNDSRVMPEAGKYYIWVADHRNGYSWSSAFPESEDSSFARNKNITLKNQVTLTAPLEVTMPNDHDGNAATATFKVTNFGTTKAEVGYIKPAARDEHNGWFDFPYSPYITLDPGQSYTYNDSRSFPAGKYHIAIADHRNGYSWSSAFPESEDSSFARSDNFTVKPAATLIEPLKITMPNPTAGNIATATFKIKNFGTKTVEIGYIKPAARDEQNTWSDFPYSSYVTLQPGDTYVYSKSRTLTNASKYRIWIADKRNGYPWSNSFPTDETANLTRQITYDLKNEVRLTTPLSVTKSGNTVTGTFSIKNYGSTDAVVGYIKPAGRDSHNGWFDMPYSPYITLKPGESYNYNLSRLVPAGKYNFYIANKRNSHSWSGTFPASQDSSLARSVDITIP